MADEGRGSQGVWYQGSLDIISRRKWLQSNGMRRGQRIHPGLAKAQIRSDCGENLLGGVVCTNA